MSQFITQLKLILKEIAKDTAHQLPFVPYRKRSRRRFVWRQRREQRFLALARANYQADPARYDNILVSIVMPLYNRALAAPDAIDSVMGQTHRRWELLVVDDGSDDDVGSLAARYAADPRVKFLRRPHAGCSAARNSGIDAATGDYIFYLDSDNRWLPHMLRAMVVFMEAARLDVAFAGIRLQGDNGAQNGYFGDPFDWDECWEMNYIDVNSLAHRRQLAGPAPRFSESLRRLVDWDFLLDLTFLRRTAFAPFVGVAYYDGAAGERITRREATAKGELTRLRTQIQQKHLSQHGIEANRAPHLHPDWRRELREALRRAQLKTTAGGANAPISDNHQTP